MISYRRLRRNSRLVTTGIISAMFFWGGCSLDQRAQEFVQDMLDSAVSTATETFILTPINNFITGQIDQALNQVTGNN